MTTWMTIVLNVMLLTSCLATTTSKTDKKKDRNPNRYITNWSMFGMPPVISVNDLKRILDDVALYNRGAYCPFGPAYEDCRKKNYHQVVSMIVSEALGNAPPPEVKDPNSNYKFKLRSSTSNDQHLLDVDDIEMEIVSLEGVGKPSGGTKRLKCHFTSELEEQGLYGQYKTIKVPRKFKNNPKKRRNKPFQSIFAGNQG